MNQEHYIIVKIMSLKEWSMKKHHNTQFVCSIKKIMII